MRRATALKHATQPVTVRVGGRQWTIGGPDPQPIAARPNKGAISSSGVQSGWVHDESPTHALPKPERSVWTSLGRLIDDILSHAAIFSGKPGPESPETSTGRWLQRAKEAFVWGCVFGLLLGCLCVIATHQTKVAVPSSVTVSDVEQPVQPVSIPTVGPSITVPAVRLYGLYWSTDGTADSGQATGNATWHLWRVAAYSADLVKYESVLPQNVSHPTWKIEPVAWNVHPVSTLPNTPVGSATRMSSWLSSEVSAMTALVAAIADGEPAQDAWTAYKTATSQTPQSQFFAATGKSEPLHAFAASVQTAFADDSHDDPAAAALALNQAVSDLQQLVNS